MYMHKTKLNCLLHKERKNTESVPSHHSYRVSCCLNMLQPCTLRHIYCAPDSANHPQEQITYANSLVYVYLDRHRQPRNRGPDKPRRLLATLPEPERFVETDHCWRPWETAHQRDSKALSLRRSSGGVNV